MAANTVNPKREINGVFYLALAVILGAAFYLPAGRSGWIGHSFFGRRRRFRPLPWLLAGCGPSGSQDQQGRGEEDPSSASRHAISPGDGVTPARHGRT